MKNVVCMLVCCCVLLAVPALGQVESHDLSVGAIGFYAFSDDDFSQGYSLSAPYLDHAIEIAISDMLTLSVSSGAQFFMSKFEAADDAWNSLELFAEPELEVAVTDTLSITPGLSAYFANYKWDDDRESMMGLDAMLTAGFSTMAEDLAGISPWQQFERGFTLNVVAVQELYLKDAGEKSEESDRVVGLDADYAYFDEYAAFMVAPSFSLRKHLNDEVSEALELTGSVRVVKDLSAMLTGGAIVEVLSEKFDGDADWESQLRLGAAAYLNLVEKLEIMLGAQYVNDLSDDDIKPAYGIGIGLEYDLFSL